jgi:hypothetical protein
MPSALASGPLSRLQTGHSDLSIRTAKSSAHQDCFDRMAFDDWTEWPKQLPYPGHASAPERGRLCAPAFSNGMLAVKHFLR